ncbi:MAG TPA: hypothetical protein VKB80_06960 [Kofleriaceae bacterium]|nr:hypothetical protein [Kofleriaceae bacterium]
MSARRGTWLFSREIDLAAFLGSAAVALALVALGPWLGVGPGGDSPGWTWVSGVLLVDVAHVYATLFVVYLEPEERGRRAAYWVVPAVAWLLGVLVYSEGAELFWRALAYVAVFHFVRQQVGWVRLYRARVGERDRLGAWIDSAAIYASAVYPLVYWHAHLPRAFAWFVQGDFAGLPGWVASAAAPLYWGILACYAARSLPGWLALRPRNPGKDIVVATTAVCWYAGIVATNSDYAFTVTNVLVHGLPYMALVYVVSARAPRRAGMPVGIGPRLIAAGPLFFVATLWLLAYAEELLWDRAVWHEHAWLFGSAIDTASWHVVLVPLLAVPQLTHYLLDGFVWRRRSNPRVAAALEL